MTDTKNEKQAMSLTVTDGLTVTILPDSNHEFLMLTKEVANGYGTSTYAVQKAFLRNNQELIEGKHFLTARTFCPRGLNLPHNATLWTKRGVVRLGFFIKSERAKMFRDWAEELIIKVDEQQGLFGQRVPEARKMIPEKRNHNRLTQDRLLSIMADVCRIEDKDLRLTISGKLMNGGAL